MFYSVKNILRKCKAEAWNKEKKKYENVIGYFHVWGKTYEELGDGAVEISIGIIEKEDGQVVIVDPDSIRFLEKIKEKP